MSRKRAKNGSAKQSEKTAVYTTIVGGRPPGSGAGLGEIPRAIEVLVKKASVDPEFRDVLLHSHTAAAKEINLELTPAEAGMLGSISRQQLEEVINRTRVSPESRRAFLGKAASVMLAALGVQASGCSTSRPENTGPDISSEPQEGHAYPRGTRTPGGPFGIRPDLPPTSPFSYLGLNGIRPGRPPTTKHTRAQSLSRGNRKPTRSRQYVVKEGDSLSSIAAVQLGDARRYKEIIELNPGVIEDQDDLKVGMQLNIPAY